MEWIPIEREAPKDGQKILVCYEDGTILGTRYNPRSLSTWLAWMPQPKPYTADTPQTEMDKCYKCKWWNYSYGCSNKKGICEFEPIVDTSQTERKSNSEYFLELADAVIRGEMSDASANQAWYEYINKQDTPQTEERGDQ